MSLQFEQFDSRGYEFVPAREGYGEWVGTYEQTVQDEMDLVLLSRLQSVPWSQIERAADLGCGTGRTGQWLRAHGVTRIDGVDITPEMIEQARRRNMYHTLKVQDILHADLEFGAYGLVVACLVDEHIPELDLLYRQAARILTAHGWFVIVGYHPQFIMTTGMPTHFHRPDGTPIAIETHVHLFSDHVTAARQADFELREMHEATIGEAWLRKKPKWQRYFGQPISFAMVWQRCIRA